MSSSQHPDDWWSVPPRDRDREDADAMAAAAEELRAAAEALRDANAPAAPEKESNWDWSWLKDFFRHNENGKALKRAAYTTGPAMAFVLWAYSQDTGNNGGAAAFFFALIVGAGHLYFRRPFTRLLFCGAVLAPLYYFPAFVSILFGATQILVGGAK
ncbi:hypothetical protein [Streptomyces sp. CB03238]|uniref:hypothetical protein n=1 Tax=Streptomyces sp. CB03238 TaxID=1907777 RepID=UPI000A122A08|nr:hypothetical protein [Streptomyces sp. CB03238]ORT53319.1 hypothetical protein BKD26_38680 [Streptomyces sp. CB03238]